MPDVKLLPPCTYQGGKQRLSGEIIDYIDRCDGLLSGGMRFYDMCCGSGSISLELINRGFCPGDIHMCDVGPWGMLYHDIGQGLFDMARFRQVLSGIPDDKGLIRDYVIGLSRQDACIDRSYIFLVLQACSFGGRQIWIESGRWRHSSFRSYWQPTERSIRRSPVNPMQPGVDELARRVGLICDSCLGLTCDSVDIQDFDTSGCAGAIVYMDPPYPGTTGYFQSFDIKSQVDRFLSAGARVVYVSLDKPLCDDAIRLAFNGPKGGISGYKSGKGQEWLSVFRA